jgi:hypothetical protein
VTDAVDGQVRAFDQADTDRHAEDRELVRVRYDGG